MQLAVAFNAYYFFVLTCPSLFHFGFPFSIRPAKNIIVDLVDLYLLPHRPALFRFIKND